MNRYSRKNLLIGLLFGALLPVAGCGDAGITMPPAADEPTISASQAITAEINGVVRVDTPMISYGTLSFSAGGRLLFTRKAVEAALADPILKGRLVVIALRIKSETGQPAAITWEKWGAEATDYPESLRAPRAAPPPPSLAATGQPDYCTTCPGGAFQGAQGGRGSDGQRGANGEKGRDAPRLVLVTGSSLPAGLIIDMMGENGQPGQRGQQGGPGGGGERGSQADSAAFWCNRGGGYGGQGGDGGRGGNGGPGGDGGTGGSVEIRTTMPNVELSRFWTGGGTGGRGGEPGLGGDGGSGGLGGPGDRRCDDESQNRAGRNGASGAAGLSGPHGMDGAPGRMRHVQLKQEELMSIFTTEDMSWLDR